MTIPAAPLFMTAAPAQKEKYDFAFPRMPAVLSGRLAARQHTHFIHVLQVTSSLMTWAACHVDCKAETNPVKGQFKIVVSNIQSLRPVSYHRLVDVPNYPVCWTASPFFRRATFSFLRPSESSLSPNARVRCVPLTERAENDSSQRTDSRAPAGNLGKRLA